LEMPAIVGFMEVRGNSFIDEGSGKMHPLES